MNKKKNGPRLECPICRRAFTKKTKWQKFCSDRCRFENWLRKEMQKRIDDGVLDGQK